MNAVDKLIDITRYSNLFGHIGFDDWIWTLNSLDKLKAFAEKDEEVKLKIKTVMGKHNHLFAYVKKLDIDALNGEKYLFYNNDDISQKIAADYFAIGCIKVVYKTLGLNITPKPIELALLAIKGGLAYENRKRNLDELAKHFDLKYETLSVTHSRLANSGHYEPMCYNNAKPFEVSGAHKLHIEWVDANYPELQRIFSWLQ